MAGIAEAVAGYGQKCFSYHYDKANRLGTERKDIEEIIEFAKAIRSAGSSGMDEFVERMVSQKGKK